MNSSAAQFAFARIGIVSDDRVQQHTLKVVLERLGYAVVVNVLPERLADNDLFDSELDLWLVDLFHSDEEHLDWLDKLLDGDVPVLLGAGKVPPQGDEEHPRWEKRFFAKIKQLIPERTLEAINSQSLQQLTESETSPLIDTGNAQVLTLPKCFEQIDLEQVEPLICVLGASLGGPEAVKQFLDVLPSGLPVAFIYAQHIDVRFEQVLIDTLSRHSHYDMVSCEFGNKLKAGEVMLAPVANMFVFADDGSLETIEQPWPGPYGPSVDQVMLNVWQYYKNSAVFLIFSGMGNDGADACTQIAKAGGQIWSQEASSCGNSSMPMSAVETGHVSYIGTPQQLAIKFLQELQLRWSA